MFLTEEIVSVYSDITNICHHSPDITQKRQAEVAEKLHSRAKQHGVFSLSLTELSESQ